MPLNQSAVFTNPSISFIEASNFILQRKNVCYGTTPGSSGSFNIRRSGRLVALKLIHKHGEIFCSNQSLKSRWGCVQKEDNCQTANCISTFVTNARNNILFPNPSVELETNSSYSYNKPNVMHDGNYMIMRRNNNFVVVTKFEELRIWFGITLQKVGNYGQHGEHCVDVYGSFN